MQDNTTETHEPAVEAAPIQKVEHVDMTGNPAPLGLFAFGMTTILLCFHFTHIYPVSSMLYGMIVFYGGFVQAIVGILEWTKKNTFGTLVFASYGSFWLSLGFMWLFRDTNLVQPPERNRGMAMYLFIWGCFTWLLFGATFKMNRVLQAVLITLATTFWLLALTDLLYGNGKNDAGKAFEYMGGVMGIICAFLAMYFGIAQVYNEVYKKVVLPIFPIEDS